MTSTPRKTSKRSRLVMAGLVGFSALTLSACKDDHAREAAQVNYFDNPKACQDITEAGKGWWAVSECTTAFNQSKAAHEKVAPRYGNRAECEAEHGAEECEYTARNSSGSGSGSGGSGSLFRPRQKGFILEQDTQTGAAKGGQPAYPRKIGGYRTADGTSHFSISGQKVPTPVKKAINRTPSKAVDKVTTKSRSGFGTSRTSSSSGSRFGG